MIRKKFNKHLTIISRRLKQASEIKKMRSYNSPTLNQFLNAFEKTKRNDFSSLDKESFARCEQYRNKLLKDESPISREIFNSSTPSIVRTNAKASSTIKWCQLLYSLTRLSDARNVLEIGTNLGVSGTYILEALKPVKNSLFITMEGLPRSCEISSEQFSSITDSNRFEVIQGLYDSSFPELMAREVIFDLAFIDGYHQKEPTLQYFQGLKTKSNRPVIFIFDDINWSKGMKEVWSLIKSDKDVSFSIDMWRWGVVIIDDKEKCKNIESSIHLAF